MGKPVTIKVIRNGKIVDTAMSSSWSISMDALAPEDSTFTVDVSQHDIKEEDLIIVEQMGDPYGFHYVEEQALTADGKHILHNVTIPLYCGIVTSWDLLTITARDLVTYIHNAKVLEASATADCPGSYLSQTVTYYIQHKAEMLSWLERWVKEAGSSSAKAFTRTLGQYASTNMNELMYTILKYYQCICTFAGYTVDSSNKVRPLMVYHQIENDIYSNDLLKSKMIDMNNAKKVATSTININIQPSVVSGTNVVNLVRNNKNTAPPALGATGTNGINLKKYYMQSDGKVVLEANVDLTKVVRPFVTDTVLYEPKENNGTYTDAELLAFASASMSKDTYAHNISFDYILKRDYPVPRYILNLGQPVTLRYEGKKYASYITGYTITSEQDVVSVTCGNIRTGLNLFMKHVGSR